MKELNEAKVLAVGPGGLDKEGKRIAPSVAPGDKVLIPQVGHGIFSEGKAKNIINGIILMLVFLVWRKRVESW